jgi:hypothetical protein
MSTLNIQRTDSKTVHARGDVTTGCGVRYWIGPRSVGDAYWWSTSGAVNCKRCLKRLAQ